MAVKKRQRKPKTSPNTASFARGAAQEAAYVRNSFLSRTPWQKAKDKRFHSPERVAKRKRFMANA